MASRTTESYIIKMKDVKKEKFDLLYRENYNKVLRLCLGYVSGKEDLASDLLQEVFIKVWQHWSSFKGESSRSTWVYRITVNTCLQELRLSKKYRVISLDNIEQKDAGNTTVNKEQQFQQLYGCINTLTKENKSIILLELEGLPQQEIAAIIGIKHNALRTRISRIKKELTKCVQHENI